jgi:hypothetical protein
MNEWKKFGEARPQIGDEIDVIADDVKRFGLGAVRRVVNVKDLDLGKNEVIVAGGELNEEAWSIDTDHVVGAVVRSHYKWRLSSKIC